MSATTPADAKAYLLSQLPVLLSAKQLSSLFNVHYITMHKMLKDGKLPFRNVSISKRGRQYLAIEVVDYLIKDDKAKIGRPVGSKNKRDAQAHQAT